MSDSALGTIFYVSRSLIPAGDADLQTILTAARRNNALRGITGVLLWTGGYFVQVLEGRLPAIVAALRLISGDSRHTDIRILEQGRLEARRYGAWDMALVVDAGLDPLIGPLVAGTADAETWLQLRQRLQELVLEQHGLRG